MRSSWWGPPRRAWIWPDRFVTGAPSPRLSVSIVSHGHASLTDALLRQIVHQTSPGLVCDITVTLNLPESIPNDWGGDGWPPVRVLRNQAPKGFAANHNAALANCRGDTVAILNPDLELRGDCLGALARAAGQPGVGLVVPTVLESDGRVADAARELLSPASVVARTFFRRRRPAVRPVWYAGMCMVLPLRAWLAVGGFDSRYRMYCEDFDLCARLRLQGFSLMQLRSAEVVHAAGRGSHRSLRPFVWHVASLARLWRSPVYRDFRRLLQTEGRGGDGDRDGRGNPSPKS